MQRALVLLARSGELAAHVLPEEGMYTDGEVAVTGYADDRSEPQYP